MSSREQLNAYLQPPKLIDVTTESGTTRTLSDIDINKRIYCTNGAGCIVTVPDGWPVGAALIVQAALASGAVTIVRAAGMAFESVGGDATKTVTAGGEACVAGIDATAGATIVAVNGSVS